MAVVTVSRQYGAGGRTVAVELGRALGLQVVDRELAEEAARRLGADPEAALARDERVPSLVEEVGLALAAANPALGFEAATVPQLDDRSLADATRRVIESLAGAGGYVILGRGAQAVLAGRADVCHVSLVGKVADRARRVAELQHDDEREAADRCHRADGERAAYLRHFYGKDIRDPLLYDVVVNTSEMSLQDAADVAVLVARRTLGL
jgi:cytidylate kinase